VHWRDCAHDHEPTAWVEDHAVLAGLEVRIGTAAARVRRSGHRLDCEHRDVIEARVAELRFSHVQLHVAAAVEVEDGAADLARLDFGLDDRQFHESRRVEFAADLLDRHAGREVRRRGAESVARADGLGNRRVITSSDVSARPSARRRPLPMPARAGRCRGRPGSGRSPSRSRPRDLCRRSGRRSPTRPHGGRCTAVSPPGARPPEATSSARIRWERSTIGLCGDIRLITAWQIPTHSFPGPKSLRKTI
jgi:hypothetical protein